MPALAIGAILVALVIATAPDRRITPPYLAVTALALVGHARHDTRHLGRAVTAEKTVYILHPWECLKFWDDREQVRLAGNAVTPPSSRDLIAVGVEALGGAA